MTAPFMSEWKIPLLGIGTQVPCFQPPWGMIGVIDLNTNKLLWKHPHRQHEGLRSIRHQDGPALHGRHAGSGGHDDDARRTDLRWRRDGLDHPRASDLRDGKVKWQAPLPGSAHATPMTYLSPTTGKQYVVITVPNPPWQYPALRRRQAHRRQGRLGDRLCAEGSIGSIRRRQSEGPGSIASGPLQFE